MIYDMETLEEVSEHSLYSELEMMVMREMIEKGFNPWYQKHIKEFWKEKLG